MTTGTPVPSDDRLDVSEAVAAGGDVDVLVPGRMDERLLDDGDEIGVEHLVAAQCHQPAGLIGPDVVGRIAVRTHRQHPDALAPGGHHDRRVECVHLLDAGRWILGPIDIPVVPPGRRIDGSGGNAKRFGVQIRDDQEAIALGSRCVLHEVLDKLLPRTHQHR